MSEPILDELRTKILLACHANSHGDYEHHWINGPEQKAAVIDLIKNKLISRGVGDGTTKAFVTRLSVTEKGRVIADKLLQAEEKEEVEIPL